MQKSGEIILLLLLGLFSVFPFQYQILKVVLSLSLIMISMANILKKNKISKYYLTWFLIYIFYNLLLLLYGEIQNRDIYKYYLTINVIWPLIYFFIFSVPISKEILKKISKLLEYSFYLGILVLMILYINFNYKNIIELKYFVNYNEIHRPGQYSSITASIAAISPMLYINSILISKYLIKYIEIKEKKIFFIIFLSLLFLVLTMRKILIITNVITIIITLCFLYKKHKKQIIKFGIIAIFMIVFFLILNQKFKIIDIGKIVEYIFKSFDYTQENYPGVEERKLQFRSLIIGFMETPFIGSGIGANTEYIRSSIPGMYELSYVAMLFQRGLLGTLVWLIFVISIFKKEIRFIKSKNLDIVLPYLCGFITLIVMNGTNPYIGSFEFDWMLYINLMVINLLGKKAKKCE